MFKCSNVQWHNFSTRRRAYILYIRVIRHFVFHLLSSSCQIFYCIYRPTRHFAYVCSNCRYVAQKEDGCEEQGEPDYVAIDLLYRHKHHGVKVVAAHKICDATAAAY